MTARVSLRAALGVALLVLISPDLSSAQVEIKRVFCSGSPCPQPMELPADFPTRINLRGTRLGRLSSGITVQPTGFPDGTVTVRLGRTSSDGSRRVVVLTSSGSSTPALSRLQLQFRTTTGQTVTAMADGSPFEIEALGLPDLVLQELSDVLPHGISSTRFYLVGRIVNDGYAETDARMSCSTPEGQRADSSLRQLRPGQGENFQVQVSGLPVGAHWFTCTSQSNTRESDETNNARSVSRNGIPHAIRVFSPPDLIIEDVSIEGDPKQPTGFEIRVRNQGDGPAFLSDFYVYGDINPNSPWIRSISCPGYGTETVLVDAYLLTDSVPWSDLEFDLRNPHQAYGVLDPGASMTQSLSLSNSFYRFPTGPNTCMFYIDWPGGSRYDENDTNNSFTLSFSIPGGP